MLLDTKLLEKAGIFGFVSAELITYIGGGFLLGKYLDEKFHFGAVFKILLPLVGLALSVWRILQISKKWFHDDANSDISRDKD